jgi:hypothetical protein
VRQARLLSGLSMFQRCTSLPFARQFVEARAAPEVGVDAPVVLEQFGGGDDFAEDGPEPSSCTRGAAGLPSRRLAFGEAGTCP